MSQQLAQQLSENGLIPDRLIRAGIRKLLQQRLQQIGCDDIEAVNYTQHRFLQQMAAGPIAELPEKANEQHYEVPVDFYLPVLGAQRKYSCSFWGDADVTLNQAEESGLRLTCDHAELRNGMDILELGCGWGSLTLYMARHYPDSRITAVSNSASQGQFIRDAAIAEDLHNITVITADMNQFAPDEQFDRVVSVEMFEHMRNWQQLFRQISQWLRSDGKFFMHIFTHRSTPYLFEIQDSSDWMSRHFFSGGMMPSTDLPLLLQQDLLLQQRWQWDGRHYEKTANAWLANMDSHKEALWPVMQQIYGADFAKIWWMRWRMFFMACAELFGYNDGQEWFVSHYLFQNRCG